jgi:hypothetical protein
MTKCTDRTRREMFNFILWGTKSHHNKLKSSIYHTFRKEILPYLNINILSKHFQMILVEPLKILNGLVYHSSIEL